MTRFPSVRGNAPPRAASTYTHRERHILETIDTLSDGSITKPSLPSDLWGEPLGIWEGELVDLQYGLGDALPAASISYYMS